MSINHRRDKQNVVCSYSGMLFGKKEEMKHSYNLQHGQTSKSWHQVKEPEHKRSYTLRLPLWECPENANLWKQEVD